MANLKIKLPFLIPASLKSRYLLVSILLSGVLVSIAISGWKYVNSSTQEQIQKIQQRAEATSALNDLMVQIQSFNSNLHMTALEPNPVQKDPLVSQMQLIDAAFFRLVTSDWVKSSELLGELSERMQADLSRLKIELATLHQFRKGLRKLFPAVDLADDFRKDIKHIQENIDPILNRTLQRVSAIRLELNVGSAKDITDLTNTAKILSDSIAVIATSIIVILFVGLFFFNRALLKPISHISHAMKAEALGGAITRIPPATAIETQELNDAFSEMRHQVRSRQAHLDFLAHHDPLTELPNRVLLRDRVQHAVDRSLREDLISAILFLDLDRFKQINDSLGHNIGDELLNEAATRITTSIRAVDTVARLGGDEFAILIEDLENENQAAFIAQKILNAIATPFLIDKRHLHVTTSIGIAICPNDGTEFEVLTKNADTAMYHAKEQGRNTYAFYADEMTAKLNEFLGKETKLRSALEGDEFALHYQPIFDTATGEICALETLIRWHHPEQGLLAPGEFLPVLEETGLIVPVTDWVINQAFTDFAEFQNIHRNDVKISLNFSPKLIETDAVAHSLRHAALINNIDPERIIIEITEDTLMENPQSAEKILTKLKETGHIIALDDFGKGQSSLNRLRLLPIDIVKIDKDFVKDVSLDSKDAELISAIISMAHNLNKQVIAEGVEKTEQLNFLHERNCDAVQGFLLGRPSTITQLIEELTSHELELVQKQSHIRD